MTSVALLGIGSTNLHSTIGTPEGDFVTEVQTEPTEPHRLEHQLLEQVDTLQSIQPLDAIAISLPGLVDPDSGIVRKFDTPDGEVLENLDLRSPLEDAFGIPVVLENDCTASALGEWYFGHGEGHDCVMHVTFGTGIGGGVVENGQLLRGEAGQSGEFGLMSVAPESDLSSTGVTGAWEAFCSGRGIPRYAHHRLETDSDWSEGDSELTRKVANGVVLSAPTVFNAAGEGDPFAETCLDQVSRYNAAGIGALCNAFNPGLVTLGGGVALHNREWLLEGIERYLETYCFVDRPSICISPLGEEIGLYGALGTWLEKTEITRVDVLPYPGES